MNDDMSLGELATLTGETLDELRRWQELGLLPRGGPEDRVSTETAEQVRLIQFAIGKGLTPEEIGRVNAEQDDLLAHFTRPVCGRCRAAVPSAHTRAPPRRRPARSGAHRHHPSPGGPVVRSHRAR